MSRKKNKTTVELQAAADHVDQEIARLQAEKKDLRKQINETARKERNAHLYFRGGELTHHLQDKAELLTDEDIKQFLTYVFSFSRTQKLVSDMRRSGEARPRVPWRNWCRAPCPGTEGRFSGATMFRQADPSLCEGAIIRTFRTNCALRGPLRGARWECTLSHSQQQGGNLPAPPVASTHCYSARR